MPVFRSIGDVELVHGIEAARQRLVFAAPGMSAAVAEALQAAIPHPTLEQIAIVVDGDEETCRLGYGDAGALARRSEVSDQCAWPMRQVSGVRLGLLMSDDEVLSWPPTPLMLELPRQESEPKGLVFTAHPHLDIVDAVLADEEHSIQDLELGAEGIDRAFVEDTVAAVRHSPPAPFDLTRLARVFSSRLQFIETALRGAELIKRDVRLDNLIVNSDAAEERRPLLHTTIQPFSGDADKKLETFVLVNGEQAFHRDGRPMLHKVTQAEVHACWADLTDRSIVSLPGFGRIIRQVDKASFGASREAFPSMLNKWVDRFQGLGRGDHDKRVARILDLITARMAQSPAADPGGHRHGRVQRHGWHARHRAERQGCLQEHHGRVRARRRIPGGLKKAMPGEELKGRFHIYNAAPVIDDR